MLERVYEKLELNDLVVDGEKEIWKKINEVEELSEFKDWYWISLFGRVKSIGGRKDKILRQGDCMGYLRIGLITLDGKQKKMSAHRLVALAFVSGWSEERNQANHINEVKTDNRAINLNWMSARENNNFGTANKRRAEKLTNGIASKPVIGTCVKTGKVIEFLSTQDAHRNGFNSGHVSSACRGIYNHQYKHGGTDVFKGYRWKYEEEKEENVND